MSRRPIRSVIVMGKRYRVERPTYLGGTEREEVIGDCDAPHATGKTLRVRLGLDPAREVETWIHEALHAAHWHHDEKHVEELARDIARILVRAGLVG